MAGADILDLLKTRPRPIVMGIVNVTPDSFSDGGLAATPQAARDHALALLDQGADILDVGAESTRPGAADIGAEEELSRMIPALEAIRAATAAPISADTRRAAVARAAVAAGAGLWNDVSALSFDPDSLTAAADLGVPVVLMHAQGSPGTMQDAPRYRDVVGDVLAFLAARIGAAVRAGVDRRRLIVDPGIGFGKTLAHNLTLTAELGRFAALGCPVLYGASRKSFIARVDPRAGDPADRLGGSLAAALAAADRGAAILRVHDVAATVQALAVRRAVLEAGA
jgi:dihydropteroate synthase